MADLQQRMKDRVLQVRRVETDDPFDPSADRVQSRPYDGELVPPVHVSVVPGVEVATYEGNWPWVPQFASLPPLSTSTAFAIDAAADLSRTTDAGLQYRGYLRVPADGKWTFFTASDADCHLRIHDAQVIDDDFTHDGNAASGTVLLRAGLHPFTLNYRTASGAPFLDWHWSGPGTPRQAVPQSALFRVGGATDIPGEKGRQ